MINPIASRRRLIEAGVTEQSADAIVEVVHERGGDLVTKDYLDARLAKLEMQMKAIMAGVAALLLVAAKQLFFP